MHGGELAARCVDGQAANFLNAELFPGQPCEDLGGAGQPKARGPPPSPLNHSNGQAVPGLHGRKARQWPRAAGPRTTAGIR